MSEASWSAIAEWLAAVLCVLAAACLGAQASSWPQEAAHTRLRAVRVQASGPTGATVTIEADGLLPTPHVGVLDAPPRIFLDLIGVIPAVRRNAGAGAGPVRRVRVALHEPDPVITRVVIDLAQEVSHTLDAEQREAGVIQVTLTALGESSRAPEAVSAMLLQLQQLRPLLSSIDARRAVPEDRLRGAVVEFEAISEALAARRESPLQQALVKICALGRTAASLRLDAQQHGNEGLGWSAASAAAGALIELDRVVSTKQ